MTVYVDDMRRAARPAGYRGRGTPRWSHLLADSHAELIVFAHRLGLSTGWLQHEGRPTEHFDVTETVRQKAIKAGAVPIGYGRQAGLFTLAKGARRAGDLERAVRLEAEFRASLEEAI